MFISNRGVHPTVDTYETVEALTAENERLKALIVALENPPEASSPKSDAVVAVTGVGMGSVSG
jgi:hypothetical protein